MLHFIGYIKNIAHMQLKFSSKYKEYPIFTVLIEIIMNIDEDKVIILTDLSWNDSEDPCKLTLDKFKDQAFKNFAAKRQVNYPWQNLHKHMQVNTRTCEGRGSSKVVSICNISRHWT